MNASAQSFPVVDGVAVTHRYVDIDGLRVHVAEAGEGEPLIMLHGWPQHWWMWRKQIPHFAGRFRVIAPDIRGFGWTEATPRGYLKDELADDLVKLIDALGYKSVQLLSHDWGGWIGLIASARNPGLISRHFANNICPIWFRIDWKMIPATIQLGYMFRIAMPYFGARDLMQGGQYVHHLFTRGNTRKEGWTDFEKNVFSERLREPARARASSKLYADFLLKEYVPVGLFGKYRKYHLETPTRILFGDRDFAIALSWLDGYQGFTDDLEIELVPETGHFIVDEKPDLVNQRAMSFFLGSPQQALS
jgi:pimeloyl-ACP methyl ester carboxylesterase